MAVVPNAHAMGSRLDTALGLNALLMALWRRQSKETVLVHSDQSCQFTGHEWQGCLREADAGLPLRRCAAIIDCRFNLVPGPVQTLTLRLRIKQREWVASAQELCRWIHRCRECATWTGVRAQSEVEILMGSDF